MTSEPDGNACPSSVPVSAEMSLMKFRIRTDPEAENTIATQGEKMKSTRRKFIAGTVGSAVATTLLASVPVLAQDQTSGSGSAPSGQSGQKRKAVPISPEEAKAMGNVTLLFVQNAQGV